VIYQKPAPDAPIDQGDLIDGCPVVAVATFHLAKHFADTFSRIGLPEPYPTV
jgi:hypothetical protein